MKIRKYSKKQIFKGVAIALCAMLSLFLLIGSFTFGASAASVCDTYGHRWNNGTCSVCGYDCQHNQSERYRSTPDIPDIYIDKHIFEEYCDICGLVTMSVLQDCIPHSLSLVEPCQLCGDAFYSGEVSDVICAHSWVNGVCSLCKFACEHVYSRQTGNCLVCGVPCLHKGANTYEYVPLTEPNHMYHSVRVICDDCGKRNTSHPDNGAYMKCNFVDGFCTVCLKECIHKYANGSCTRCKITCPHEHYTDGICDVCLLACTHDYQYKVKFVDDPNYHNVYQECTICHSTKDSKQQAHTYVESRCNACWYVCAHTERITTPIPQCAYCDHICEYLCYDVDGGKEYRCITCGDASKLKYQTPSASNLFERPLTITPTWNGKTALMFDNIVTGKKPVPFVRLTIDSFVTERDYNASIHFWGVDITQSEELDNTHHCSRYLVLRMRKYAIEHLEFYLYGGDTYQAFPDINYECTSIHWFEVESLDDDEWYNVVIDLESYPELKADSSTYKVGDDMQHFLLSAVARFGDPNGYIDFDYVALVDSLQNIDFLLNRFDYYEESLESPYIKGERDFGTRKTHYFVVDNVCSYCKKICNHEYGSTITDVSTKTQCGQEKTCDYCEYTYSSTVSPHVFKDGNTQSECVNCDYVCKHLYSIGKCLHCERACEHVFLPNRASCSVCYYIPNTPTENDDTLAFDLITSIYDAQATTFLSLLNYDIFGVNIAMVVGALVVLAVTIFIVKKVK